MIHGLTPRLAEAGKIKIGWKIPDKKKDGTPFMRAIKLDHFVITTTTRDAESGLLMIDRPIMDALNGANRAATQKEAEEIRRKSKVRELPIVLHSDSVEEVAPSRMAMYGGPQKCLCSGDGLVGLRTVHGSEVVVPGTNAAPAGRTPCAFSESNPCGYYKAKGNLKCKPNTRLACSILVEGASIAGAVYVHRTTSEIAHEQLIGSLAQVQRVVGSVRGVPLWLVVRPMTVRPEGKATTVYVCHVELKAPSIIDIQRHVLESRKMEAAIGGNIPRLALAAIGEEDDEEARDIAEEFYPVGDVIDVPQAQTREEPKAHAAAQEKAPKGKSNNGLAGRIRGGGKAAQPDEVPPHDPVTGEVLEREPGDDDPGEVG